MARRPKGPVDQLFKAFLAEMEKGVVTFLTSGASPGHYPPPQPERVKTKRQTKPRALRSEPEQEVVIDLVKGPNGVWGARR